MYSLSWLWVKTKIRTRKTITTDMTLKVSHPSVTDNGTSILYHQSPCFTTAQGINCGSLYDSACIGWTESQLTNHMTGNTANCNATTQIKTAYSTHSLLFNSVYALSTVIQINNISAIIAPEVLVLLLRVQ